MPAYRICWLDRGQSRHAGRPTLQRSVSRTAGTGIGSTIGYGVASRACCRLTRCGALQHPDGAVPIGPAASPGNITQIGSTKGIAGAPVGLRASPDLTKNSPRVAKISRNGPVGSGHEYYWDGGHRRVCRLGHTGKALGLGVKRLAGLCFDLRWHGTHVSISWGE